MTHTAGALSPRFDFPTLAGESTYRANATRPFDDSSDDWQLVARLVESTDSLATLFERHRVYVHRVAWGVLANADLADDVTQEVFLRLARGAHRFKPRTRFTTFLYRLTINTSRELSRKHRKHQRDRFDVDAEDPRAASEPEGEARVQRTELLAALATLSARQREVLVLRHFEGFSTEETANILGCRQGTVKTHLHRAKLMLAEHLDRSGAVQ